MMKPIYEEVTTLLGGSMIKRIDPDGKEWWIPMDEANSDYQRYLAWLENPEAEQSTPIVTADE
jgi:hypothetical protein